MMSIEMYVVREGQEVLLKVTGHVSYSGTPETDDAPATAAEAEVDEVEEVVAVFGSLLGRYDWELQEWDDDLTPDEDKKARDLLMEEARQIREQGD